MAQNPRKLMGDFKKLALPYVVIQRMPLYSRELQKLLKMGSEVISSEQLGELLGITPEQVRKDLSYIGRFGKRGKGLDVKRLAGSMREKLGLDEQWNVLIIGLGRVGGAIAEYPGLNPEGFEIVAAFDNDRDLIGKTLNGLTIMHPDRIPEIATERNIKIGIVAVPAESAQIAVDQLVDANIKAILNYAPIVPIVPDNIVVESSDPIQKLQQMTGQLNLLPKYGA